jgi:hypothetical protein
MHDIKFLYFDGCRNIVGIILITKFQIVGTPTLLLFFWPKLPKRCSGGTLAMLDGLSVYVLLGMEL